MIGERRRKVSSDVKLPQSGQKKETEKEDRVRKMNRQFNGKRMRRNRSKEQMHNGQEPWDSSIKILQCKFYALLFFKAFSLDSKRFQPIKMLEK